MKAAEVFLIVVIFVGSSMQKLHLDTEEWKCGVEAEQEMEDMETTNISLANKNEGSHYIEIYSIGAETIQHNVKKQYRSKRATQKKGMKQSDIDIGLQDALWTLQTTRFVELAIVVDNSMYLSYKSDEDKIIKKVQDVVDIVNAIFKDLDIVVVLQGIEIWKEEDQVEVTEFYNRTLSNFKPYREVLSERMHHDNLALFTGVNFLGLTVGFAPVSTMCAKRASVTLNMANAKRGTMAIAETLAHEMGHNLGMGHDGNENGVACKCPTKRCIMGGKGDEEDYSPEFQGWSDCSKKFLAKWFSKHQHSCLNDVPIAIMAIPHCGNGVVEMGEECDCGPAAECNTKCCNATTCTLNANATCGAGACCDLKTCSPREGGWECRKARDTCDLSEYCRGGSNTECPPDVRKMEGQPCPQGHCYQDRCGSYNRDEMCKALWGPTSNTGKDSCRKFETSKCGAPWCSATKSSSIAPGGGRWSVKESCRRINSRGPNDWRPPNGANCGDHQYCVEQKCVPIPTPAEGQCPSGCSGYGVCNTLGNCHCDANHAPPDCAYPGLGGSVDSGPMGDNQEVEQFKMGVYLAFLLVVPLLAVLWYFWWNSPLIWTAKRRASVQKNCPCLMTPLQTCCCPFIASANIWMYDSIACCRYCYPQKTPQATSAHQATERRSNDRSSQQQVGSKNGSHVDMSKCNGAYVPNGSEPKSNVVNHQPNGNRQINKPNPLILRIPPELVNVGSNSGIDSSPGLSRGLQSASFQPARLSSRSAKPIQRNVGPVILPGVSFSEHRPTRPPQPIIKGPHLRSANHSNLGQTSIRNNSEFPRPTNQNTNYSPSEVVPDTHIPTRRAPGPPASKGQGKRLHTGAVSAISGAKWNGSKDTHS